MSLLSFSTSRGYGPAAIVIPIALLFGAFWVDETFSIPWGTDARLMAAALILSGVLTWFLGKRLNRNPDGFKWTEESRESEKKRKNYHAFLWIPLQYWSAAHFAFATLLLGMEIFSD